MNLRVSVFVQGLSIPRSIISDHSILAAQFAARTIRPLINESENRIKYTDNRELL